MDLVRALRFPTLWNNVFNCDCDEYHRTYCNPNEVPSQYSAFLIVLQRFEIHYIEKGGRFYFDASNAAALRDLIKINKKARVAASSNFVSRKKRNSRMHAMNGNIAAPVFDVEYVDGSFYNGASRFSAAEYLAFVNSVHFVRLARAGNKRPIVSRKKRNAFMHMLNGNVVTFLDVLGFFTLVRCSIVSPYWFYFRYRFTSPTLYFLVLEYSISCNANCDNSLAHSFEILQDFYFSLYDAERIRLFSTSEIVSAFEYFYFVHSF